MMMIPIISRKFEWPDEIDSNCDEESFFQNRYFYPRLFTSIRLGGTIIKMLSSANINEDGTLDFLSAIHRENDTGKVFWLMVP